MVQDPSFDMRPTEESQQTLDGLKTIPTATVYNAVRHFGSPVNVCEGLVRLTPGTRFAARARTLRFLPIRTDLLAEVGTGPEAPEYLAMERCGRGDALVVDLMGNTRDVVGGDVKLLELAMNHADGVIIDGAIRDLDVIIEEDYGLAVYAKARSFHGNPETRAAEHWSAPAMYWSATETGCWWSLRGWQRRSWNGRSSTKRWKTTSKKRFATKRSALANIIHRPRR